MPSTSTDAGAMSNPGGGGTAGAGTGGGNDASATPGGNTAGSGTGGNAGGTAGGNDATIVTGNDAGSGANDAGGTTGNEGGVVSNGGPCDLSGAWISTHHELVSALGAQQTVWYWQYREIVADGSGFKVKKGLFCGPKGGAPPGLTEVFIDSSSGYDLVMEKVKTLNDSRITSTAAGANCNIGFDKVWIVRGMNQAFATDPTLIAKPLPSPTPKDSAGTPGWQDWDEDGNPGITSHVKGLASGDVYSGPREWNQMTSPTNSQEETKTGRKMITPADISNGHFIIPLQWGLEQNTLGATSFILNMSGAVVPDPTKHFVEFVRLKDGQVTATDDRGICSQVRGLLQDVSKSLTPTASAF